MTGVIETSLLAELGSAAPLPPPHHGRLSRRVRNFPVSPRVGCALTNAGSAGFST
jgi:hypothetical protein